MTLNGRVPVSDLTTVQAGIQLSTATARAWFAMAADGSRTGHRIGVASPAGGYRSLYVQADMRARPWLYNLSKVSTKKLANPGSSTHGLGTRVDVVGDLNWVIANGRRFGFWREFGNDDPNHFAHDGVTATAGINPTALIHQFGDDMQFARDIDNNNALLLPDPFHEARWFRRSLMGDQAYADWTGRYTKLCGEGTRMVGEELTFLEQEHNLRVKENLALLGGGSPSSEGGTEAILAAIAAIPAAVIVEQKKPGN